VRLTCGVREALGPAWQCPKEEDSTGRLHTLDWARVIIVLGQRREKRPTILFPISNPFFNLKKNQQEEIKIVEILMYLRKM
jgi:hypothetical protein